MPEVKLAEGYSLWKSIQKGLGPAVGVAAIAFIGAFLEAVKPEDLVSLGLPAGIVAFLVPFIQNWWKNRGR